MISYGGKGAPRTLGNLDSPLLGTSGDSYKGGQPTAATGIVERAASVLARDVASGSAPHSVVAPVSTAMTPAPMAIEDLRRQAREWIDRVLAIVSQGVPAGRGSAPVQEAVESITGIASDAARGSLPVLAPAGSATGGDIVKLPMRLMNDAGVEAPLKFATTDLIGESGHRIPGSAISFWPENPIVQAGGPAVVEVKVTIPAGTPTGNYAGLIRVVGQPDARTLVSIRVG